MLTHQLEIVTAKSGWADYALLMFLRHGTPVPDFDLRIPDCRNALTLTRTAIAHAAALLDPTDPTLAMDDVEVAQELSAELLELNAGTHAYPPALCSAVASAVTNALSAAAIGTPMWNAFRPGPVDLLMQAAFTGGDALTGPLDALAAHVSQTHGITDQDRLAQVLYDGLTAGYAVTPFDQLTLRERAPYDRAARAAAPRRELHA
ncbi:hypothetical protein [Deinococcus kurensis]|uniref:hypothetical protein n=1 Tax=Deinococcus kurensis TaxID=2662757 RepID=UPI0012D2BABF|nr:hypothetical protein [Deinococcus kurensis]